MDLAEAIDRLREDQDVVRPFADRLLQRIQERHGPTVRLEDVTLRIEVCRGHNPAGGNTDTLAEVHRLLADLVKESVSI